MDSHFIDENIQGAYRIITLGESTTAGMFKKRQDISWPYQLQERLIQSESNPPVSVLNLAEPGTNSAQQIQRLEKYLESYRPHLVISMLGINDSVVPRFIVEKSPLQLFKLARLARHELVKVFPKLAPEYYFRLQKNCGFEEVQRKGKIIRKLERLLQDLKSVRWSRLKRLTKGDPVFQCALGSYILYEMLGGHAEWDLEEHRKLVLWSTKLYRKSMRKGLHTAEGYLGLATLLELQERNDECVALLLKPLSDGKALHPAMNHQLIRCLHRAKRNYRDHPVVTKYFDHLGIQSISLNNAMATRQSYQRIRNLLESHSVSWIIMQYPTLSLQALKKFLANPAPKESLENFRDLMTKRTKADHFKTPADFGEVQFVENRVNFDRFIAEYGYEAAFSDRFAGPFGHATKQGNALIVDNLIGKVELFLEDSMD